MKEEDALASSVEDRPEAFVFRIDPEAPAGIERRDADIVVSVP
jgi:hypothetical protein